MSKKMLTSLDEIEELILFKEIEKLEFGLNQLKEVDQSKKEELSRFIKKLKENMNHHKTIRIALSKLVNTKLMERNKANLLKINKSNVN